MSTAVLEQPTKLDLQETPPFPVMRFTLQQYWDLRNTGVLDEAGCKYELLQGWIVPKVNHHPPHAWTVTHIGLVLQIPDDWFPRTQCPINTDDSEPEPDFAVVRMPESNYVNRHPRRDDIGLLIEVAESTLRQDRRKAEIYAADGIPAYWIINLVDRQIEVHTQPDAANSKYQQQETRLPGESVTFNLDGEVVQTIPVDDLLPPTES